MERDGSDNIVVQLHLSDGTSGFGEGVPREYVTGETPASCFAFLEDAVHSLCGAECASFHDAVELAAELPFGEDAARPQCAARAALEAALLDAAGRRFGVPLYRLVEHLPDLADIVEPKQRVRYGVVLSAGASVWKALAYRVYGFRDVKVKVGLDVEADAERVTRLRKVLGRRMDIRLDANGAWAAKDAPRLMRQFRKAGMSFVEQPLAKGDEMALADVREKGKLPVMLDESLVSERDAQLAVDGKRCDAFNLRISKNGGMIPVMKLAALGLASGMTLQLGCHPEETGILSAAGRAVACSVRGLRYLEGSYGRHLLAKDVVREDVTFGRGGRAPRLEGPGLGVTVDALALDALTEEVESIG